MTFLFLLISMLAPAKPLPKMMCNEACVVDYCYHRCQPNSRNDEAYMRKWSECSSKCLDYWDKNGCREMPQCQQDI